MKESNNMNRYSEMVYNFCGRSGLKLPAVSLGLWHNFGSVDTFSNMQEMAKTAFDLGITHFDLANNYGPTPGSAEENFGRILKTTLAGYRDELVISTKAGYGMWPGPYGNGGSRKYVLASLDQSLKRMGVDYVDIFYSHRFDAETPLEETMGALASAVKQGKALYVGVSNYNAEQTRRAYEILADMGVKLLINQPCYNMLNRWIEPELVPTLEELGVGSIAFSPLAQGQLTDRYINGIPKDSRAAKPWGFLKESDITEEKLDKIKKLNEIAAGRGQTLAEMALVWNLKRGKLTSVLIGASRPEQIRDNVAALKRRDFTEDELSAIDEILK
ncbi:MAG: L-glyceraldehyde 3-phosphate reductase [Clostridiales bacterium]|nr:L-glyceraldehyde 3-phosphate reductase [Clostridiales bacterium]